MSIDFQSTISYTQLLTAYRITFFAAWGIGVDFPRLLARYARSYPMVLNIHSISMMIIGLITLLYVIAITITFYTQNYVLGERMEGIVLAEFILAWALCACILVQFGLGFKVRYEIVTDKLSSNVFSLKKVHRYLGTFMSILGKVIVALQLQPITFNEGILFKSWLFILGTLLLVSIVLQVVYRIQTRSVMVKFPLKHQCKHRRYLQQILHNINNNAENFPDYRQLGIRYIILDNRMYYIDESFIHPGGQHIFSLYNGQEVNYLFRGTHHPSPDYPRHNHTKYAFNYLQEREIGKIQSQSILLNYNANSEEIVQWKMTAIQQMEADTSLVEFQAGGAYVRQNLNVETFGKYMMIACPGQEFIRKQRRPYSLVLSLCNQQQNILHRFKQSYKYYFASDKSSASLNNKNDQLIYDVNERKSALTFCIKSYKDGLFTKFMFSSQTQRLFKIEGPYGRGLRLKPASKGFYILIASGTGVIPYIDFLHFMLQKTLYKLIRSKGGDTATRKINEQRIDYDQIDNIKILFIGSFASSKHFYLSNIIKDLYHLNCKHDLNQFNMRLRYNNNQSQPGVDMIREFFDRRFIQSLLEMKPDRIYYCGVPSIQHVIRKVEVEKNVKNKFFYI